MPAAGLCYLAPLFLSDFFGQQRRAAYLVLRHFLHLISNAGASSASHIIYGMIVAFISTIYAILFMPSFLYTFLALPADFCLERAPAAAIRTGTGATGDTTGEAGGAQPYVVNRPSDIRYTGWLQWRTVLAFEFMAALTYLLSAILPPAGGTYGY
ncbi:hypothetical protein B0H66DRAFT_607675 [Apodospora peruviana]|uniref:Uncharacterized protein n=1 Tax=Apodospora peruviana TaxID=516989 RepID=A0AAE0HU29_9PEZI|nr:hypothetical protein B0H66DRAFT_607675 [Apodospora peruviana]